MLKSKLVFVVTAVVMIAFVGISCVNTKAQLINKPKQSKSVDIDKNIKDLVQKQLDSYLVHLLQVRNKSYSIEEWAKHIKSVFRPNNPLALIAWDGMWDDFIKEIRSQRDEIDALLKVAYLKFGKDAVPPKPTPSNLPGPQEYIDKSKDY